MNDFPIRVLELYSGIGGMHCALEESDIAFEVVAAIDINTTANRIYRQNFPKTKLMECGIETLTVKQLDKMKIDMILMSPPCQPFTRVGKKRDTDDIRTNSFLHLLDLLPRLQHCPSYILVENVKGFEESQTRDKLVQTLKKCEFVIQECLLTPLQFGVPNSRLRYYLIAKRKPLLFHFNTSTEILQTVPEVADKWLRYKLPDLPSDNSHPTTCTDGMSTHSSKSDSVECLLDKQSVKCSNSSSKYSCNIDSVNVSLTDCDNVKCNFSNNSGMLLNKSEEKSETVIKCDICRDSICLENYGHIMRQNVDDEHMEYPGCRRLYDFLEHQSEDFFNEFKLPDKDLTRFIVMDIVHPCLRKSSCFTKRYGHFMEGAGSIVQMTSDFQDVQKASEFKVNAVEMKNREQWGESELSIIRNLCLRYFTPREIANLLCFPSTYSFPADISRIQLYRVLGNSLNVHVVSVLIRLLLFGESV